MKFVGIGKDRKVFMIVSKRDVRELGEYDWGANPPTPQMRALSQRLLMEVVDDPMLVTKFYMRFMYHVFAGMERGMDWQFDSMQIEKIVDTLKEADREVAQIRQMAGREFPRIANAGPQFPGASGFGGNDTAPDRRRR